MATVKIKDFSFKLRGRVWNVYFVDKDNMPEKDCYGLCFQQNIHVRRDVPNDLMVATLFHELTHAALECLDTDNSLHDENVCSVVGDMLVEVLPQLPKWLAKVLP